MAALTFPPQYTSAAYYPPATSGWFANTAATNVQIYPPRPIYIADPPPPPRKVDPLDWVRERVQECVDMAVLA